MAENLAPWRSRLQRALHRNRSQVFSRYFQLATINEMGYPTNRTVVFRGFLADSNSLQIITDTRSEKYHHLQNNPQAEICWYFAKTREQFRIQGKVDLVTQTDQKLSHLREQVWQKLSDNAKEQFLWPHPGKTLTENVSQITPVKDNQKPVSSFCLLLLNPQKIDHLELKGNPQKRCIYLLNSENNWLIDKVNP